MFHPSALRPCTQRGGGNEICVHGSCPHERQGKKKRRVAEKGMQRANELQSTVVHSTGSVFLTLQRFKKSQH